MAIESAHMDFGSRNERLYEHLKAMGLYVMPVFSDEQNGQIDHFHVSAGLPAYLTASYAPKQSAAGTVAEPVKSADILRLVPPTMERQPE